MARKYDTYREKVNVSHFAITETNKVESDF